MYDKCDNFDFDIINFPFLDGDVPCRASWVYISKFSRFARVWGRVLDFNIRNVSLIRAKLLQREYQYHKLRKTFSKFYLRHYE